VADVHQALAGRTAVVTGASSGIGRVTAEVLAAQGAHVVLACRSEEKTRPIIASIRAAGGSAEFEPLDLGDLASVRDCAKRLLARLAALNMLIDNAGVAGTRGTTKDGFETAFGTNHVGHFVLTLMLMPRLRSAPAARIVVVASIAHFEAKEIGFEAVRRPTRSLSRLPEYAFSKLANVLFAKELARRLGPEGPHTYALHPGVIASDIWRHVPWPIRPLMTRRMLSNEAGARTSLYCATSPEVAGSTGRYYEDCREVPASHLAEDPDLARSLWEKSVEWTGTDLPRA
jgi:NAD(P)-dependent dehydrogenase (short-subunit alcohol dehydrogenase family)